MEQNIFQAGLPKLGSKKCKQHADMYEVTRAQGVDGKTEYITLSTALDRFAANVHRHLSGEVCARFNFDFSAEIDFCKDTDISKVAKSVKNAFCKKLDASENAANEYLRDYFSANARPLIWIFLWHERERGHISTNDIRLLDRVTSNGKVKLTENRDTKDKAGNKVARDESLNITYKDENGKEVTVNYKVDIADIPSYDFDSIVAAYKIAAKATNVNSRYDKANKPKAESELSSVKKENEDLKAKLDATNAKIEALQAQIAALQAQ